MGKPRARDYWRKWRAAHPEYMDRERARSRARVRTREQRRGEKRRSRAQPVEPPPPPRPRLVRWAMLIVRYVGLRPDGRTLYHDPLFDDAVAVAVMHLWLWQDVPRRVRREKAIEAVRMYVKDERAWRWRVMPLYVT